MSGSDKPFASRGGEKLRAALDAFALDVAGWTCADFGANVGGFTDCLLARGAGKVFAVDTGYGELAWRLRKDPRVVVRERTNALHAEPPEGGVDLVTIDVAFTPQRLIAAAAARWLKAGGHIVSLLKPHYERAKLPHAPAAPPRGPMGDAEAEDIRRRICAELAEMGLPPLAILRSPLLGKGGNPEFLLHIRPAERGRAGPPTRPGRTIS